MYPTDTAAVYPNLGWWPQPPSHSPAVRYGEAWHPTRQIPDFVQQHLPYLRQESERLGRDPGQLTISLKRALHFTDIGLSGKVLSRSSNAMIGRPGK
jgi:hypothetical protein